MSNELVDYFRKHFTSARILKINYIQNHVDLGNISLQSVIVKINIDGNGLFFGVTARATPRSILKVTDIGYTVKQNI